MMKQIVAVAILCVLLFGSEANSMNARQQADILIKTLKPLPVPRGERLPLIIWRLENVRAKNAEELERVLVELDKRGIATVAKWRYEGNARKRISGLTAALDTARIQKKLGIPVVVNSTHPMHRFCNGSKETAHITEDGEPFFDSSFSSKVKIGCPFALRHRYGFIRGRVEYFVDAYKRANLPLDVLVADWEIDGPLEWNDAWQAGKKCKRCRANIPNIDNFAEFQSALRRIRCDMQKKCYADIVKASFPNALVGNYAVYPHDGQRYWYDYFEKEADVQPYTLDQKARNRPWFHEFPLTGYTFAMPVVYTWYPTFGWYDFENTDYRWFYNMLLVGSNAGKHTSNDMPLITFLHWHTTAPPKGAPTVKQFSEQKYQELLWHLLLRGHDAFAMWCTPPETKKETRLVQEVYAASLEYAEYLDKGEPINFEVPKQPGPVVSGLRLGNKVLVRRTDFDDTSAPITIRADGMTLSVPRVDGSCQVLSLKSAP